MKTSFGSHIFIASQFDGITMTHNQDSSSVDNGVLKVPPNDSRTEKKKYFFIGSVGIFVDC